VKPGLDLLAAFGLALGAHAVLGLVLAGPDGRGAEGEAESENGRAHV